MLTAGSLDRTINGEVQPLFEKHKWSLRLGSLEITLIMLPEYLHKVKRTQEYELM